MPRRDFVEKFERRLDVLDISTSEYSVVSKFVVERDEPAAYSLYRTIMVVISSVTEPLSFGKAELPVELLTHNEVLASPSNLRRSDK